MKLTEKIAKERWQQASAAKSQEDLISAFQELLLQESKKLNFVLLEAAEGCEDVTTKVEDDTTTLHTWDSGSIPAGYPGESFRCPEHVTHPVLSKPASNTKTF